MKTIRKYLFLVSLTILTVIFIYYTMPIITLDDIWNYGFAYNIATGLIPYKDFNMIIPPLFIYIVALFLKIFGYKLIVYYFLISIFITIITYISYQKIGLKAIIIYILLLIYPYNGYNTFSVFLIFILLKELDNNKRESIIIPIIISMIFLSKQTLGLLIIPSLIYSKNKKKTICIYLISIFILLIYLITNNNLYEFIDYCFLGMFDFSKENNLGFNIFLLLELIICIIMLLKLIKTKFKDKKLFFIFMFQILAFPIVDYSHFVLVFAPVVYYFISEQKFLTPKQLNCLTFLLIVLISAFYFTLYYIKTSDGVYINYPNDTFLKSKKISLYFMEDYTNKIKTFTDKYDDYQLYLFISEAYLFKLELNLPINKYDLINNGNMGYKGDEKYIEEIDNYCQYNKCMFITDYKDISGDTNQINKNIITYVYTNYQQIYASNNINVYVNVK